MDEKEKANMNDAEKAVNALNSAHQLLPLGAGMTWMMIYRLAEAIVYAILSLRPANEQLTEIDAPDPEQRKAKNW